MIFHDSQKLYEIWIQVSINIYWNQPHPYIHNFVQGKVEHERHTTWLTKIKKKKLPSNPLSSPTSGLYSSNFSPFENNPLMISSWIIFLLFWLLAWDKLPEVSVSQWLWALWWPLDVKPDYSPQELYQFPPANEGVWGYQFPLIWYPISWHPMMTSYLNLEMTLSWVPTS